MVRSTRVGVVMTCALLATTTCGGSALMATTAAVAPATLPPKPNIVLILTDDQRWDQLSFMPTVESELVGKGMTFTNGFVTDPLCCPSRASILRGQYSHGTGVYQVGGPYGAYHRWRSLHDDKSTIATWLHGAGYYTGFYGKYLNGYKRPDLQKGWDQWHGQLSTGNLYYNYTEVQPDGSTVFYGSAPQDYSTDVLAGQADAFIRGADPSKPFFLDFDPRAPHSPSLPAPRYATASCPAAPLPPSLDEDTSDKPAYIRAHSLLGPGVARSNWLKQCRSLLAVDDAVRTILTALQDTGRLSNTLIVFMSDNGFLNGEHNTTGKKVPYEESVRVPIVVRYDPLTAGTASSDPHLVANIDIAPTFAAAAGVVPPIPEDGLSLLPLLNGTASTWRTDLLLEGYDNPARPIGGEYVPTYCGLRTERYAYYRYDTGEEELYDLQADPYELTNLLFDNTDPSIEALRATLLTRLQELCNPPPPHYSI
jgi:N-acetylglucosamine-6-sulfatase